MACNYKLKISAQLYHYIFDIISSQMGFVVLKSFESIQNYISFFANKSFSSSLPTSNEMSNKCHLKPCLKFVELLCLESAKKMRSLYKDIQCSHVS